MAGSQGYPGQQILRQLRSVNRSGQPAGGGYPGRAVLANARPAPSPSRHEGGGGALGFLGHLLSQTGSDLYHAAVNTPAGIYYLGKGLATDPVGTAKTVGEATLQDFEHPLRHPGYTALDALGVLSAGAGAAMKAGAAARAFEEGATVRGALAAAARATPKPRELRVNDLVVRPETSRRPLAAAAQRASDKALMRAAASEPKTAIGGAVKAGAETLLHRRAAKIITARSRMAEQISRGAAEALLRIGRKLSPGEQKALQVVAEEAPLENRITAASARVTGARTRADRRRHQVELDLLHQAAQHLTVRDGKPALIEPRLQKVYDRMAAVARDRETLLKSLGALSDEAIQRRKTAAARVALGQPIEEAKPPTPGQLSLLPDHGFTASREAVRIPDVAPKPIVQGVGVIRRLGNGRVIGHPRKPGSLTHEYTGHLREHALRRQDTTRLVAESSLEASRFAGLLHLHDLIRKAAAPVASREDDIAVRLDKLKPHARIPHAANELLSDPEQFFSSADSATKAAAFRWVHENLFFDKKTLDPAKAEELRQLERQGKVGWVPRRLLGEFADANAPLRTTIGRRAATIIDSINNASRLGILYLKPAFALPNMIGNAGLVLLQQGWASIPNLTRAAKIAADPELAGRIDAAMGEGVAGSISAHGAGALSRAVDAAARTWGRAVDVPFRRASFIYEARRAGYKTPQDMLRLLTDPKLREDAITVALRANRELIDYGALSPVEREIVRRLVFFYPWVKGSTVYGGRLLREHPAKAAVAAQVGRYGREKTSADLGQLPSYLEGVFRAAGGLVNPASAAIFQTPAQVGLALQGAATGNVPEAGAPISFVTPALELAANALARRNLSTGQPYKTGQGLGGIAYDTLIRSLPQYQLATGIIQAGQPQTRPRLYKPSERAAILKFLLGGLAPRPYDPRMLAQLAHREQTRMRTGY